MPQRIRLEFCVDENDDTVCADPTRIEQIVLNPAINARDGVPARGLLCIDLQRICVPDVVQGGPRSLETGYIAVSDTGEGIPSDVLPDIFETFAATKVLARGLIRCWHRWMG